MRKPIRISIPSPCHEDWEQMTPAGKGRFCASCQKNVIDFSRSSDREIAAAFAKDDSLCGRFLDTQLDRDLIRPTEKSSWWIAASATVLSLMAATTKATAQTNVPVEQTDSNGKAPGIVKEKEISGIVSDEGGPLPGATVKNINTGTSVSTDIDGNFTLVATVGDTIEVSFPGYDVQTIAVRDAGSLTVTLTIESDEVIIMGYYSPKLTNYVAGGKGSVINTAATNTEKKRTFFGKIFYNIGKLFR